MADFCKQCSEAEFGDDFRELAGITTPEDWAEGKAAVVICEGCGPCQVDPDGVCISSDCLKKHGATKPLPILTYWAWILLRKHFSEHPGYIGRVCGFDYAPKNFALYLYDPVNKHTKFEMLLVEGPEVLDWQEALLRQVSTK